MTGEPPIDDTMSRRNCGGTGVARGDLAGPLDDRIAALEITLKRQAERLQLSAGEVERRGEALKRREGLDDALRVAEGCAFGLQEELAFVRRELAESHGEEETSEVLRIYESFKDALKPFGYEHLNVRARIELLIQDHQRRVKVLDAAREAVRTQDTDEFWKLVTALDELDGTNNFDRMRKT